MWRKIKEKDNGLLFNEKELNSINNAINYLKGKDYNKETINDDMMVASKCANINLGNFTIKKFYYLLIDILNNIDITQLVNDLFREDCNPFYKEVLKHRIILYLKNELEKADPIISNVILSFRHKLRIKYKGKEEAFDNLTHFGNIEEFPSTEKIINNFLEISARPIELSEKYKLATGHCAELFTYMNLMELTEDDINIETIWCSKEIGDGFGYDIMVVNHDTMEVKLIEVKGTAKEENQKNIILTNHEQEVADIADKTPNTRYYVIKNYLSLNPKSNQIEPKYYIETYEDGEHKPYKKQKTYKKEF